MHEKRPYNTFSALQSQWPKLLGEFSRNLGFSLIHVSAIGARTDSDIPYQKSKGLGEILLRKAQPKVDSLKKTI